MTPTNDAFQVVIQTASNHSGLFLLLVGIGVTLNGVPLFISLYRWFSQADLSLQIPTRKAIKFTSGIFKKGSNDCYCSNCSSKHDMKALQTKFDEFGFADCPHCGEELFRLVMVRLW